MANLEIKGLDALIAKLDALGGDSDKAMMTGMKKATRLVGDHAKANCAVNLGQLRASIMRKHEVKMGEIIGKVGTNVEHGPYIEYGTGKYNTKGDGRQTPWRFQFPDGNWITTHGNKPQPFLYPALRDNQDKIVKGFTDAMLNAIKKKAGSNNG